MNGFNIPLNGTLQKNDNVQGSTSKMTVIQGFDLFEKDRLGQDRNVWVTQTPPFPLKKGGGDLYT